MNITLCTGHRVHYRNGREGIVIRDLNLILLKDGGFNLLSSAVSAGKSDSDWEIITVYDHPTAIVYAMTHTEKGRKLWDISDQEAMKAIRQLDDQLLQIQEQVAAIKEAREAIVKTLHTQFSE